MNVKSFFVIFCVNNNNVNKFYAFRIYILLSFQVLVQKNNALLIPLFEQYSHMLLMDFVFVEHFSFNHNVLMRPLFTKSKILLYFPFNF